MNLKHIPSQRYQCNNASFMFIKLIFKISKLARELGFNGGVPTIQFIFQAQSLTDNAHEV